MDKPIGDLTLADMESLTTLEASRSRRGYEAPLIASLEGLQTARNLRELWLGGYVNMGVEYRGNIESGDLSVLRGLTNLTTLHITHTRLSSFILPDSLTHLTTLNLSNWR